MTTQDFEIIRTGEYWQSLRRAKIAREARQGQPAANPVASHDRIYTFVPGRAEPITSFLHADGSVLPVASSSSSSTSTQIRRTPAPAQTRPPAPTWPPVLLKGTNSMARVAAARAAAAEALLLARLSESPTTWRKQKLREEMADAERAIKKKIQTARCRGPIAASNSARTRVVEVHPSKVPFLKQYGKDWLFCCLMQDLRPVIALMVKEYIECFDYHPLHRASYGKGWTASLEKHEAVAFTRTLAKDLRHWFSSQDPRQFE
ncbi:hypothetical protein B0H16DRAFT_1476851 [Mycena metata]|uniref:Uncharacterized protein n=1 Tax=Mycena metata TaxID=1033252 RepID=A0AAD7MGH2_9AGAR|nr:hypothetical protein B0H16DRAFT_1476851 [Mycena metata]